MTTNSTIPPLVVRDNQGRIWVLLGGDGGYWHESLRESLHCADYEYLVEDYGPLVPLVEDGADEAPAQAQEDARKARDHISQAAKWPDADDANANALIGIGYALLALVEATK